tara:strand:- start:36 stop:203 length:168 start_codon:yes stop_codon:yes gene_type:complete
MTEKEIIIKSLLIRGYISASEAAILLDTAQERKAHESDTSTFLMANQYYDNKAKI